MKQRLTDLGALGLFRDQMAHELPMGAWSLAGNMRFKDGYAQKIGGHSAVYDPPSVAPYYLLPYSVGASRYWLYAGAQKIYSVTGSSHTNITRQTAGNDVNYTGSLNGWTGCVLTGIAILNSGADVPQYWAGSGKAAAVTNWPSGWTCKALRAYKQFLFALNVTKSGTNYPHLVQWSAPAEPGTLPASWDDTDPEEDTGKTDLASDQSPIVDGLQLGDLFVIYKEASVWVAQYTGGPFVFQFRMVSPPEAAVGLMSRNGLVACPVGHVFIAQGDVMVFDGVGQPRSILAGRMKKYLIEAMESSAYSQAFCAHNPTQNEVWICYPAAGATSCNEAIIWNYTDNTLGLRTLPSINHAAAGVVDNTIANSWNTDSDSLDLHERAWNSNAYAASAQRLLMAAAGTKLYLADLTSTFAGATFNAYLRREAMDFGDSDAVKTITRIRPRIDAPNGTVISVRVGGSMHPTTGITWADAVDFTVGTDEDVDVFVTGRYLSIQLGNTAVGPWRVRSMDVEFEVTGYH
jgi:hypothetical protein